MNNPTVEGRGTRDESQRPASSSTLDSRLSTVRSGVALVITVILLAVVTFMAITFLAVSRRERGAVTTTTDTTTAQLAAADALSAAEAQIMANTLATTNPYNFGLLVSTNYINPYGFAPGIASPTNVSYYYDKANGLGPVSADDFPQLLANLHYLPRAPVLIGANDPVQGRFYLDLNRNGTNDANGWVPEIAANGEYVHLDGTISGINSDVLTNFQVGDPEWIGVLQHPDQPYGPNNPFVARYAFIAVPIGNALDLNAIYNDAAGIKRGVPMNVGIDGFMRNQGVGSWEINLAAFLADLNTNEWDNPIAPNPGYFYNEWQGAPNTGYGFEDALSLLSYRYGYNVTGYYYHSLAPIGGVNGLFTTAIMLPPFQDNIDYYSDGPLMTTPAGIYDGAQSIILPWSGSPNTNHFFSMQDLFDPNKANIGAPSGANSFTNRLLTAGYGISTYDRYTYYRLLSQMGVDSAPMQDQINLNYSNAVAYFARDRNGNIITGDVTNIVFSPNAETNLVPWTPLQFFTIAADKMLRMYSRKWIEESPTSYVKTYGMTTNISTAPNPALDPTNVPIPFGISDIPVYVDGTNRYTPAIQRVLQLAANIYDATTNNATATTPDYPSVFRPIFLVTYDQKSGYTNIYIGGYQPVTSLAGANDSRLNLPVKITDLFNPNPPFDFGIGTWTNVNVYGVPWIIGAKKGFPSFNEFYMESAFLLTRKVEVTRSSTNVTFNLNPGDFNFYEMFNLSLSNYLGVECWNSYRANYTNPISIFVNENLAMRLTNDENNFSFATNLTTNAFMQFPNPTNAFWPGYTNDLPHQSLGSFQLPLVVGPLTTNFTPIQVSTYRFNGGSPYLTTNTSLPYETNVPTFNGFNTTLPQPRWGLTMTNNLRVIIADTTDPNNWKILDYVQLDGPNSVRDLSSEIEAAWDTGKTTRYDDQWDPSLYSSLNIPVGVDNQLAVSEGNGNPIYSEAYWGLDRKSAYDQINGLLVFLNGPNTLFRTYAGYSFDPTLKGIAQSTNAFQLGYTPSALVVQDIDWQANDPLVHYTVGDLVDPVKSFFLGSPTNFYDFYDNFTYADRPSTKSGFTKALNWPGNLGLLNDRYQPWGGNPLTGVGTNMLAVKDPLITFGRLGCSDDWDFPTYKLPTVGWLGRVHRGTPWQTVYLKSPNILAYTNSFGVYGDNGPNLWDRWTGDVNPVDASNSVPVQDRLLFDLFTTAPDDNATRGQLSVNVGASDPANPQAGLAAWSALFSGIVVPTDTNGNYTIIQPAGPNIHNAPSVWQVVTNINATRTNFINVDGLKGVFEHVGDILAAPALTVSNQWILINNTNTASGISDEMYEWLPQQVMSLLRVSGTPQSPMRYVIYSYGQALKPAPGGIYTGSQTINIGNGQTESAFGMVTNYQVVAESATRAVVNFGSVVTNIITTNADDVWISMPVVTNNAAQVEQYNVLPPN